MKKLRKSLIVLGLSATAICGLGFIAGSTKEAIETHATAHVDNFEEYDWQNYSGSYYSFIKPNLTNGLNGTLRTTLTENILPKAWYTYSSSGETHLSSILQKADEDPTNSNNMIYFYTRDSVKKNAASTWNREHVWPQSLSGGCWGTSAGGGSDLLHIRPTYEKTNSTRGNLLYGEFSGGTQCTYEGMTYGYKSGGYFMPLPSVKGDVARDLMYVWTAYKNKYGNLPNVTNTIDSYNTLLKWHTEDKPDIMEAHRNDVSESSLQKNRNPFVDHPEYAWKIFGDSVSASVKSACMDAYPDSTTPTAKTLTSISVSGTANKLVYNAGESFQTAGLTVTASYNEDGVTTTENVTGKVSVSPNPLTAGTTSVTLSYTFGSTTKTTTYSGITVSNPVSKTLSSLSVTGIPTKSTYKVGDAFNMNGLTVTANFSDGSKTNVANNDVAVTPSIIQANTTKVTFSYTYEGITKTVDFSNFIVETSTFYGTADDPLTATEAMSIIRNECKTAGTFTNEQIYCRATISSFRDKDTTNNRLRQVVVADDETDILIFTLNMSVSSLASVEVGDEILFHGYGANYGGTLEFTYRNLSDGTSADVICDKFYNKIIPVTSVTFGTIDTNVYTGDVVDLPVVVLPQDATDKTLRFTSSDPSVATVDTNGQVTFLKGGIVTFTASSVSTSGKSSQITFNVQNKYVPVESISVSPTGGEVDVDTTQQLYVVVSPVTATNKNVSYTSSDTSVATVNSNGLVSFVGAGEVDITVRGADSKVAVAHFTVVEPVVIIDVREINLSESSVSLEVGETKELDYELVPENATDKSVMWTSSNNEVARVSDDGEITAFKAGTATITISTLDKSISDTCLVTVIDKPQPVTKTLVEIVVAKNPDKTTYELNEPYDETGLVIEAHYLDGSSEDVTNQCESNKDSVKTSSVGLSRINYIYKTFSIFVNIYVLDNQPTELKITKNPLKLNYFAEEEFSTIGLEVKAVIGGIETIVTNLVNISYDFESENKFVTIEFGGLTQQIEVTIETGTITVEHKAVDYTYVFEDKLGETAKDKVTLDSWKVLEYYYNSLDDATKEALKSVVTAYGNGEVSAAEGNAEKLKECVSDYDEIYLLHKDEGFNDFMKRSPKAPTPTPTPDPTPKQGIDPVILVAIIGGVVVLIILIIVISVSASKKGKKKHA
ncbi:MAG: Ig-like domain-containing protein [Bacilli bacterium]|nr:Ig-like domain-containing protein [Bacilli bacterium]